MKYLLSVLMLVIFPSMAAAQPAPTAKPKAVIEGPTEGAAGDLAIFTIGEGSRGKTYLWLVVPKKPFLRGDGGTSIGFASRDPVTYTIILVAVEGDAGDIAQHVYHNGVGPTPPNPPPTPPGPFPPPNALSDLVYAETMKLPAGVRSVAPLLTAAYVRTAAMARSGSHDKWTVGQFMESVVRVENRKALGDQAAAWGSWDAAVRRAFERLWDDGEIKKVGDLAGPFDSVVAGLRRVR